MIDRRGGHGAAGFEVKAAHVRIAFTVCEGNEGRAVGSEGGEGVGGVFGEVNNYYMDYVSLFSGRKK